MAVEGLNRRTADRPEDRLLNEYLDDPRTRFVVLGGERRIPSEVLTSAQDAPDEPPHEVRRPAFLSAAAALPHVLTARATVALGEPAREDGLGRFGIVAVLAAQGSLEPDMIKNHEDQPQHPVVPSGIRDIMSRASEDEDIVYLSALSQAQAILSWHATHEFSPETGSPTSPTMSGWVRVSVDGAEHYPRTDPAVIVALVDQEDRLILGHNALWPSTRYSTLAGFVEPSETPEEAVVRELREEAGVVIDEVRYLGAQPWPFPRSLMLGYIARTASVPQADGVEITTVRAFTRTELTDAVVSGEIVLPGELSISRALINAWLTSEEA
jgi:NADH pyrophosphatase NudC (nudix superfamily)